MSSCEKTRDLLVLHAEGALEPEQIRAVEVHLASCRTCRREAEEIATVKSWLSDPALFSPTEDAAWEFLPARLAARTREAQPSGAFGRGWSRMSWALSLAAVILLTFGITWVAYRRTAAPPPASTASAAEGNEEFLGRIESLYARKATMQYLNECQDLLLNVIHVEKDCGSGDYDVGLEVARARQLLQKKRMLDNELRMPDVARAKPLCDELETFLINLSTSRKCESPTEVRHMERFIQRQRLMLRINLLQSELS